MAPTAVDGSSSNKRKRRTSIENQSNTDSDAKRLCLTKNASEKDQISVNGTLSKETRDNLANIISLMARNLPSPLDTILSLHLPPDFEQTEENTLGYLLQQPDLSWDQLVDVIHLFSENVLSPVRYPNPVPPRASFNIAPPPLPSQFPPHAIYNFCGILYSLLLKTEPITALSDHFAAERWALVQHTSRGVDWFTGAVDFREASKWLQTNKQKHLLKHMVSENQLGGLFCRELRLHSGYASPISLHSAITQKCSRIPALTESILRRASLKMGRWKETRANRYKGGFGLVARGGKPGQCDLYLAKKEPVKPNEAYSLTPTFGPMWDSSKSSAEQGYYSTVEAMHEKARHCSWTRKMQVSISERAGNDWQGCVEQNLTEKNRNITEVENILEQNAELIGELQAWQDIRYTRGTAEVTERENLVANELTNSLSRLIQSIAPSAIVSEHALKPGWSHQIAQRLISSPFPSIRGILDPRRIQAIHDTTTIQIMDSTVISSNATDNSSNPNLPFHAPPSAKANGMLPPQFNAPPPHILPTSGPHTYAPTSNYSTPSSGTHPSHQQQPTSQVRPSPYPYSQAPSISSVRGLTGVQPINAYMRPIPGPSSLRQGLSQTPHMVPSSASGNYGNTAGLNNGFM
nr:hypothetical protein L203_03235 [Cryptococcus depauperatus CBS 7841]